MKTWVVVEVRLMGVVGTFFRSSRLFLYLGVLLIFLALVCLPARVWVATQPETPEIDLWYVGPIYAILIVVWAFPNLLIGITESLTSKKAVLLCFTPILCLTNIILALSLRDAFKFWSGFLGQWLLSYSPFLIPCLIANIIGLLYFAKSEKLTDTLKNPKMRILLIITFGGVPLFIAGGVLYLWQARIF